MAGTPTSRKPMPGQVRVAVALPTTIKARAMQKRLGVLLAAIIALSWEVDVLADVSSQPFVANKEDAQAASRALGFCRGQEMSLEALRTEHPDLAPRAILLENVFKDQTGGACDGLEAVLRAFIEGPANQPWAKFSAEFDAGVKKAIASSLEAVKDHDTSSAFLDEVAGRAEGAITAEIAKPLIAASPEYWRNPVLQWPRWTRVWRADGHPKAHGYKFAVRVPVAFDSKEPTAAHMLRKWSFSLGAGGEHVMLGASIFPTQGATLDELVEEMRTTPPMEMAKALNEGTTVELLEAKQGGLLMRPAVFSMSRMRLQHLQFEIDALNYVAAVPSRVGLVMLTCFVGVSAGDETLAVAMERYRPLCDLFFGSLSEPAGE